MLVAEKQEVALKTGKSNNKNISRVINYIVNTKGKYFEGGGHRKEKKKGGWRVHEGYQLIFLMLMERKLIGMIIKVIT